MDWEKIKKKHPKAWELLKKWLGYKRDITVSIELSKIFMPERKLYDFFDEQEIYISMMIWYIDADEKATDVPTFKPAIGGMGIDMFYPDGYKTRSEAEEAAWLKAFEILEENET